MQFLKHHIFNQVRKSYRALLPERQIFFRSQGEVKFWRLTPGFQASVGIALTGVTLWLLVTSFFVLTDDWREQAKERELQHKSAELDALLSELGRLKNQALLRAERLEARQQLLEEASNLNPASVLRIESGENAEDSPHPNGKDEQGSLQPKSPSLIARTFGIGAASAENIPAAVHVTNDIDKLISRLDGLEDRQEATAKLYARAEEKDLNNRANLLAKLGFSLDEIQTADAAASLGQGGPLVDIDGAFLSDTFQSLSESLNKRRIADKFLSSAPSLVPAANYYLSSMFGLRTDPFKKTRSRHPGLDMAGWPGEPILAAGPGKVVIAGRAPAYGNMVEIDHGNGFRTRYGHMRRLHVKNGQHVSRGQKIGEMGTTGRSTSTHLHWEVWYGGDVIDPLPFLKASNDVFTFQQGRSQ